MYGFNICRIPHNGFCTLSTVKCRVMQRALINILMSLLLVYDVWVLNIIRKFVPVCNQITINSGFTSVALKSPNPAVIKITRNPPPSDVWIQHLQDLGIRSCVHSLWWDFILTGCSRCSVCICATAWGECIIQIRRKFLINNHSEFVLFWSCFCVFFAGLLQNIAGLSGATRIQYIPNLNDC